MPRWAKRLFKGRTPSQQTQFGSPTSTLSSITIVDKPTLPATPATTPTPQHAQATLIHDRADIGLRVIGETLGRTDATVDIVLVHGITGNGYHTWCDPKSGVHWPSTFLKEDIPDARILCFSYDADVTSFWGHSSRNRLSEHAKALLGDVVQEREDTDSQSRKIIFIAHSLGGLVVEKALSLSRSRTEAHLKQLEQHTIGIVFLGTPHHGSDLAAWGTSCTTLVKIFKDANSDIVDVLRPESEVLHDTQDCFGQLLEARKYEGRKINITCFYEELAMPLVGQVVPRSSASLLGYESYGIHADHAGMARFSINTDAGYKRIIGEVKRWIRQLRCPTEPQIIPRGICEECLSALYYDDMFLRRDMVPRACDRTFEWIWYRHDLGFQDWLRTGHGIFWISGKPGSGKSTLLKFLADNPERIVREPNTPAHMPLGTDQKLIAATHFFQHGVSKLACSIEGLLRSLIWQILFDHASFCYRTVSTLMDSKRATGKYGWSRRDLERAFTVIQEETQQFPLCIFIDALDEYAGENEEIAIFLDTMAQKAPPNVRFCVTSRPCPDFSFQFGSAPGFKIHDHTEEDVRIFVQSRFQEVIERDRLNYGKLMNLTIQKAEGVFLWVKLACDELRRGWRLFESPKRLCRHLEEMPKDLEGMYRRIFNDMRVEERDEACRMLAIVISAVRPLTMIEFYHALVYSSARRKMNHSKSKSVNIRFDVHLLPDQLFLPQDVLSDLEKTEECPEFPYLAKCLEGRIEGVCRCLLQVHSKRVRLLHETVETFFQSVGPELIQSSIKLAYLNGDELLLRACINYQTAIFESYPDLKWTTNSATCESGDSNLDNIYINGVHYVKSYYGGNWGTRENIPFRLSFLFYALENWIEHARKAEVATGRSQHGLLEMFSGHSFTVWRALFQVHNPGIRKALPQRPLDILIESGLDLSAEAVLRGTKSESPSQFSKGLLDDYQSRIRLLFSVAKRGSYSVANSILDLGVNFGCPLENKDLRQEFPNTAISLNDIALHRAIYFGNPQIVELFLSHGANRELEVESEGLEDWLKFGRRSTVIGQESARSMRSSSTHSALQRSNARPWSSLRTTLGSKTWTNRPLEFSILCNSEKAFFALLNSYPLGESHESLGLALTAAAFKGRTDYVRALLEHDVHPDVLAKRSQGCIISGTHTCYALLPAVYWGYFDIVELLVSRGADVNIRADLGTCGQYSLSRRFCAGAHTTPLLIARDRASKFPTNRDYTRIILLLEKSGA